MRVVTEKPDEIGLVAHMPAVQAYRERYGVYNVSYKFHLYCPLAVDDELNHHRQ